MDLLNLPGLTGWPATIATFVAVIVYSIYIKRSAKGKAEEVAKGAYEGAIKALQTHVGILQERQKESDEENHKLKKLIETIYEALEKKGIYITMQGRMVHVSGPLKEED